MRKRDIAVLALLAGASAAVATSAGAGPLFPGLRATGAVQGQYQLVQYGGGGGGGGGGGYSSPRGGGGGGGGYSRPGGYSPNQGHGNYSRPHGNGGNAVNLGRIIGVLATIAAQREQQKQRELRERLIQNQYRNQQAERRYQEDQRKRREAKYQEDQRKRRDQAKYQEDQRKRRDQAKYQEHIREERNQKEWRREQVVTTPPQQPRSEPEDMPPPAYEPRADGVYTFTEEVEGRPTKVIIGPHDGYPDMPYIPELVIGPKKLLPVGYVDLPPDRNVCKGTTARRCWLRVVSVPMANGGSKPACVEYCVNKLPDPPEREVFVPRTPVPEVRTVLPTPYVEPPVRPPLKPAVRTVLATPYIEPPRRRPLEPAVRTVLATPYVEPPRRRPLEPAVRTVLATPYVEPPKRRPLEPAVRTVLATPYVEPPKRRPLEPAVRTVLATPYVEPPGKH
jgi:hypothetical protein